MSPLKVRPYSVSPSPSGTLDTNADDADGVEKTALAICLLVHVAYPVHSAVLPRRWNVVRMCCSRIGVSPLCGLFYEILEGTHQAFIFIKQLKVGGSTMAGIVRQFMHLKWGTKCIEPMRREFTLSGKDGFVLPVDTDFGIGIGIEFVIGTRVLALAQAFAFELA